MFGSFPIRWTFEDETFPVVAWEGNFHAQGRRAPNSYHHFCDGCGRVWAKVEVLDPLSAHWPERGLCPRCGYGSLWTPESGPYMATMPRPLLMREFWLADHHRGGLYLLPFQRRQGAI